MVPLQPQKKEKKKRGVFNHQMLCKVPLCRDPVTACRYRSLCYLLCVRTLLQPVDTGLCVTSSVSGPCYSLWIQVFVLPPLCQDPVTACGYRSLCYILCVRTLLQPVGTGLCVTSLLCNHHKKQAACPDSVCPVGIGVAGYSSTPSNKTSVSNQRKWEV